MSEGISKQKTFTRYRKFNKFSLRHAPTIKILFPSFHNYRVGLAATRLPSVGRGRHASIEYLAHFDLNNFSVVLFGKEALKVNKWCAITASGTDWTPLIATEFDASRPKGSDKVPVLKWSWREEWVLLERTKIRIWMRSQQEWPNDFWPHDNMNQARRNLGILVLCFAIRKATETSRTNYGHNTLATPHRQHSE